MLAEVGCILAGIPLGYALRNHAPIVRVANGMASGIIYALLFLLGVSLGSNEQLLVRLGELGGQGVAIGLACALGSVAVTACVTNKFFKTSAICSASMQGMHLSTPPSAPTAEQSKHMGKHHGKSQGEGQSEGHGTAQPTMRAPQRKDGQQ